MESTATGAPPTPTLDLSGLPERTIPEVMELVRAARATPAARTPNQRDPARWSAELRAWAASHRVRELTLDDPR